MAISDNNPDRRNLVILSISIILFFLADGEIIDENVRLQIINVVFNKPNVLENFVWILLFWFIYRYWLTNKGSWKEGFYKEAKCRLFEKLYYPYLVKKFNLSDDFSNSWYPDKHWVSFDSNFMLSEFGFRHTSKDENGKQKHQSKPIETVSDYILVIMVTIVTFFTEPSLSTYFMPYLFALIAIILGIHNFL